MKNKKYILSTILFLILFLGTYYFVLKDYSIDDLMASLKNCRYDFICVAIILLLLWQFSEAFYLKRMCKHLGYKITWAKAIGYLFTIQYFSGITPSSSGGQPVQMIEMKKDEIPYQVNAIIVLLNVVFSKIALIFLAVIAFAIYHQKLFSFNWLFTILVMVGFVTTLGVIGIFIFLVYSKRIVGWILDFVIKILKKLPFVKNAEEKEEKLRKIIQEYQECARVTKKHPKILMEAFGIMLCQRMASLAISYAIYLAFGLTQLSAFEVIAFQICITLGSDLMPSPGGIGVNEGMLLEANKLIYGNGFATSAMLLLRSINFYAILLISGIGYIVFHFTKRKKAVAIDKKE